MAGHYDAERGHWVSDRDATAIGRTADHADDVFDMMVAAVRAT